MASTPPSQTFPIAVAADGATTSTSANRPSRNRRRGARPPKDARVDGQNLRPPLATTALPTPATAETRLHGDAPDFVPAAILPAANQGRPRRSQKPRQSPQGPKGPGKINAFTSVTTPTQAPTGPRKRRASLLRSTAPDIATRIHEDISKNVYECAICTNEVGRNSKVWSCRSCWTVFHIGCIKRWSKNEGSAAPQVQSQDPQLSLPKQWRCPGCNLPQELLPSAYSCWCEKELEPQDIPGLAPHSCGQTCGRQKKFPKPCPHPCNLMCHAGPCPPCTHMGPLQSCFCAKEATSRRCLDTNYESGWSCGQDCGDMMPCGKHTCPRPCHEGLCGACEADVEARCYCGKVDKTIKCDELGEEKESYGWTGQFDCRQVCNRLMDCGKHHCEKSCHSQDDDVPHCPRSPELVTHCPCGKTRLSDLGREPRSSCTDSIPNCEKSCGRQLDCGHPCEQVCHAGNCLPCLRRVSIKCRCGRNEFNTICHQGADEPPQCLRICKVNLNCGRHECGERCCTGERKAIERQNVKRKMKTVTLDFVNQWREDMEPEHICTRMCGRMLKCGHHTCENLCHKGACDSCKEAIFEDLSCNCGRTVLQAPLPCGTGQPPCTFPCDRPKDCGHPPTAHNCHPGEEFCPKCPFLTDKPCMCGKKTLKNQPCWRSDVSCGLICGQRLKCGSHSCQNSCHRTGDCEDALTPCQQQCGKAKKSCGHACEKPCHAPSACKEDKACPFKVMMTCDCQRKKEEVRCNARVGMPELAGRLSSLKCDDECARLERNRSLAAALHIADDHSDDHVPYSTATLKMYLEDVSWAHAQEELLREFAADPNERRLRFKPMKPPQRAFIHSMAEDFGFDGESVDPEPHRHVMLFKTPKFVSAPMKTLQQAARIKRAALHIGAPIHSVPSSTNPGGEGTTPRSHQLESPWNGLLLSEPRFALTESELHAHLHKSAPTTLFDVHFPAGGEQIIILPTDSSRQDSRQLAELLETLEPKIAAEMKRNGLAKGVSLGVFETCGVREPLLIQQKDGKEATLKSATAGGWSQVAAKGSAPARAPQIQPVGQRPMYTVLGSRLAEAKKKKQDKEFKLRKQTEVVDDWEQEVERDERVEEVAKDEPRQTSKDAGAGEVTAAD
jgi:transcriptional repressor NF-X1